MKIKRLYILTVIALLLLPLSAFSVTKVGTTAANFLKIGVGARGIAMGSAYSTQAEDATAMFWNPAGIALIPGTEAFFTHSEWIADIDFDYAGLVFNIPAVGAFGLNATFLNIDRMEQTNEYYPEGTGQFFDAGSYALGVTYARSLTDRFSIGVNAKWIRETILNSAASGFAVDIGTLFITQFRGLRIGATISNFGSKMQMGGRDLLVQHDIDPQREGNNDKINADLEADPFDLPLHLRVGVSYDFLQDINHHTLWLAVDATHPNDNVETVNIGAEYVFFDLVALRGGYNALFAEDGEKGFTCGAGIDYHFTPAIAGRIDYAYETFGRFDNIQKFSIAINF